MNHLICGCVVLFLMGCVTCTVASDMKPWRPDLSKPTMAFGMTLALGSAVVAILALIWKGCASWLIQ